MLHHPHPVNVLSSDCVIDMPSSFQEDVISKIPEEYDGASQSSSQSSSNYSNTADICRICHCEGSTEAPLITPCYCSGSLRYVHQGCLQQWIKSSNIRCCELCKFQFIMHTKIKPFNQWEYLEMSCLERKKLLCAMLFHIIAMTCVCWSLYVLIDRTLDEVQKGHLDWPFWTKLIVVGIGFMGGIVFMYIQCKAYFILCQRWKAYNRVIYVQNAPEKPSVPQCSRNVEDYERDVPNCNAKSYRSYNRDMNPNASCIDIKGVKNLHIFFNEENRIRVHKQDSSTNQRQIVDVENDARMENETTSKQKNLDALVRNNASSWHIEIANACCTNEPGTSRDAANDPSYYGGVICPSDLQKTDDKQLNKCNTDPTAEMPSVVKLQIKKAEIVIEFGQNDIPTKKSDNVTVLPAVENDKPTGNFNTADKETETENIKPKSTYDPETELPTSKLLKSYSSVDLNDSFEKSKPALTDWNSNDNLLNIADASRS